MIELSPLNIVAVSLFGVCWLFYQPLLTLLGRRGGAVINTDLTVVRSAWMHNMARRTNRFMDGQLLAQTLSSSSFFASSNLILIAATAGVLFGGQASFRNVSSLAVINTSSRLLFEGQLALVVLTLARGLLDFIWGIRQLNYVLAAIGATPERADDDAHHAFGDVAGRLLNPALHSVNSGVRGYYFALAAAAWLFGPIPFMVATLGAVSLLIWRQRRSPAARAIAELRKLIEAAPPGEPEKFVAQSNPLGDERL
ncbi:MAG: hypothetical protein JWR47_3652 [Phenylobacterium sp.]|jgi:uncharacterized membrane protein|uniref:DUF599 family protein n=1 Tax=Phenylobacterium sp. TaxID=1871053 RepID=UPI0026375194|nr:DUF599 family protein [Phenylobacterium sp.]MDB5437395.1 hypothetical protein [Phenylobacterium sp.]MDB5496040.1 hypothetical protein [Phenylobacterium sp.]